LKIIFMGTPDFAVPALTALNKNQYIVSLVVTQPDRPKGRGRKLTSPPVKIAAATMGYDTAQPESAADKAFLDQISNLQPDLLVVVAFGQILSRDLLSIPKIGTVNIHPSLLPKYRGPAPIQWSIINGDTETGVSTMFLDTGVDSGDILLTTNASINPDETADSLHDRLAIIGADLLIDTIKGLEAGTIKPVPQDHSLATHAPLLKKKDGLINWNQPAHNLESFIRGVTPWPGAYTFFQKTRLKIFKAKAEHMVSAVPPGSVIPGFPDELRVATGEGALSILEIQGASGKRLSIQNFLRGCEIPVGAMLG
jgi:methionyl-tRNA formyltransferase